VQTVGGMHRPLETRGINSLQYRWPSPITGCCEQLKLRRKLSDIMQSNHGNEQIVRVVLRQAEQRCSARARDWAHRQQRVRARRDVKQMIGYRMPRMFGIFRWPGLAPELQYM